MPAETLPEQRRRTVVWPIDPHPVFRPLTQAFADGIHQDVIRLLVHFVMVVQAMIEEVALPIHAVFPGYIFLPVFDHRGHSGLARQGQDGVQVIRHEQTKAAMPEELLVIVFHSCQHAIADVGAAQLVFTPGHTIDGDEKPTALGDPLRNCVRQLFADGQIHVRSVTKSAQSIKHES